MTEVDPDLLESDLFQALMKEGLAMQDRFAAEPVYAKTGKGYLKSAGVDELGEIKDRLREEAPEKRAPSSERSGDEKESGEPGR